MKNRFALLSVLAAFFVMGFCDVVGIATSYIKEEFALSEVVAGFIPSMVFLWFLLLAVPTSLLMNRIGRKNTVQLSNVVTFLGMMIPFADCSFTSCIVAFVLLGVGNTILQVSLNPLLGNIVSGETLTSALTAGQVVKALSSFLGPLIALFAVVQLGNWQYLFPIFGAITLLSALWLGITPIQREPAAAGGTTLGSTFSLLGDRTILVCFVGIVCSVGLDVGMNTLTPKLLMERCATSVEQAGLGASVYFVCRTAGAFIGAFLLTRIAGLRYLAVNAVVMLLSLGFLLFAKGTTAILLCVGVFAFALSCAFPIIYSAAIQHRRDRANDVSGLLVTGICGGAILPPCMGLATDAFGSQNGSVAILLCAVVYLAAMTRILKKRS